MHAEISKETSLFRYAHLGGGHDTLCFNRVHPPPRFISPSTNFMTYSSYN